MTNAKFSRVTYAELNCYGSHWYVELFHGHLQVAVLKFQDEMLARKTCHAIEHNAAIAAPTARI